MDVCYHDESLDSYHDASLCSAALHDRLFAGQDRSVGEVPSQLIPSATDVRDVAIQVGFPKILARD
jgi:hypothetical protein